MNKEKVIVYGLGKKFKEWEREIQEHYEVIAYSDKEEKKCPLGSEFCRRENLHAFMGKCDFLLVTAAPLEVIPDLLQLGMDLKKIRVFSYEREKFSKDMVFFHGEYQEDAIILLLCKLLKYDISEVRYLEIGTNNPISGNNSYNLYKFGARGVLVDPLPGMGDMAKLVRPEDRCYQYAVSDESSPDKISFYVCENSGLSSMNKNHHEKWNGMIPNHVKKIEVDLIGINSLLAKLTFIPDIIFIDAEGEDERILRAIDYEKYKPVIVMVEICDMNDEIFYNMSLFMEWKGYYRYTTVHRTNAIFVRQDRLAK